MSKGGNKVRAAVSDMTDRALAKELEGIVRVRADSLAPKHRQYLNEAANRLKRTRTNKGASRA